MFYKRHYSKKLLKRRKRRRKRVKCVTSRKEKKPRFEEVEICFKNKYQQEEEELMKRSKSLPENQYREKVSFPMYNAEYIESVRKNPHQKFILTSKRMGDSFQDGEPQPRSEKIQQIDILRLDSDAQDSKRSTPKFNENEETDPMYQWDKERKLLFNEIFRLRKELDQKKEQRKNQTKNVSFNNFEISNY